MSTAVASAEDPTGSLSTAPTVIVEDPAKPIGGAIYRWAAPEGPINTIYLIRSSTFAGDR